VSVVQSAGIRLLAVRWRDTTIVDGINISVRTVEKSTLKTITNNKCTLHCAGIQDVHSCLIRSGLFV